MSTATKIIGVSSTPRPRLMRNPSPASAPTNSPTTAPTTARMTLSLRPPKMTGRAAGQLQFQEELAAAGAQRTHQLAQVRVYVADADDRADQGRKEDHDCCDQHFAQQAAAKPDDKERGDGHNRDGLAGDEIGGEDAVEGAAASEPVAENEGQGEADQQTGADFGGGGPGMAQQ